MNQDKFYFKKSKGQNFLKNKDIIKEIVKSAKLNKEQSAVIEIGPGNGALTNEILLHCKKLAVIEIDPQLVDILNKKYENNSKIVIIKDDILNTNLKLLIKDEFSNFLPKHITIISNLPYYITAPIIFKLYSLFDFVNCFILMVQKEVGERIIAKPNTKKYNNLSIISQFYCDIEKIIDVNKENFYPIPKVDSVVLKFNFNIKYDIENKKEFFDFIKAAFFNKRKTILNNLKLFLSNKEKAESLLKTNNINANLRAENISLNDFYNLWITILQNNYNK